MGIYIIKYIQCVVGSTKAIPQPKEQWHFQGVNSQGKFVPLPGHFTAAIYWH
jgi:hypothetical protein